MLVRVQTPDIASLRRDARDRALARPRLPFDGAVRDDAVGSASVPARWYEPARAAHRAAAPADGVVFLHGGYGLFGDIELQDGYCRRIAGALGVTVLSVAYRLAPEATIAASMADAAFRLVRDTYDRRIVARAVRGLLDVAADRRPL